MTNLRLSEWKRFVFKERRTKLTRKLPKKAKRRKTKFGHEKQFKKARKNRSSRKDKWTKKKISMNPLAAPMNRRTSSFSSKTVVSSAISQFWVRSRQFLDRCERKCSFHYRESFSGIQSNVLLEFIPRVEEQRNRTSRKSSRRVCRVPPIDLSEHAEANRSEQLVFSASSFGRVLSENR